MTLDTLVLILFVLALFANAFALVRYWQTMRRLNSVLNDLIQSQQQWIERMQKDKP